MSVHGPEADRHLFRCLVSNVDFTNEGRNAGKEQLQLLIKEAAALVTKPDFISILCYSFEKQESKVSSVEQKLLLLCWFALFSCLIVYACWARLPFL